MMSIRVSQRSPSQVSNPHTTLLSSNSTDTVTGSEVLVAKNTPLISRPGLAIRIEFGLDVVKDFDDFVHREVGTKLADEGSRLG